MTEKRGVHRPPSGGSKTVQSAAPDTDINLIMERYHKTGVLGTPNPKGARRPIFGDFTSTDFLQMKNAIMDIGEQFMKLKPKIRQRFQNDPLQLVRFVEDPSNMDEAIKLGLVQAPVGDDDPPPANPAVQADGALKAPPGSSTEALKADPEANPKGGEPKP